MPKRGLVGYEIDSAGGEEVALRIGQFIINFGAVEFMSHEWLRLLCQDSAELKRLAKARFKHRVASILRPTSAPP